MRWYVLQIPIILAILFSDIQWHWAPSKYVAAFAAWLAALLITGYANSFIEWRAKRKRGAPKPR